MPFIPHHFAICSRSVKAFHTSSRGASKTRVMTISRSDDFAAALLFAGIFLLLLLQLAHISREANNLLPKKPGKLRDPARRVLEGARREPAWAPLCLAAALDQPGAL